MQITTAPEPGQGAPADRGDPAAAIDLDWLSAKIPYRRYQECVHCGLCTASCPTYVETCNENDSPRGRIYLMRAVADGRLAMGPEVREHLDLCLDCRACETGLPLGRAVRQDDRAVQDRAPEVGAARRRRPACSSG